MIHIDRKRVTPPASLKHPRVGHALAILKDYFDSNSAANRQRVPRFDRSIWAAADVKEALLELFHQKCAYCESDLDVAASFDVELFRPKWQALNRTGETNFDRYWWLAYEWSNLYPACQMCNRAKGTRFPIDGPAAPPGATPGSPAFEQELALLIDPCVDRPEQHLAFTEDGAVGSLTTRGTVTIQVLNLNRAALVKARQQVIEAARLRLTELLAGKSAAKEQELRAITDDANQYSGALKQCVGVWLKEREAAWSAAPPKQKMAAPAIRKIAAEVSASLPAISDDLRQQAVAHFNVQQRAVDDYELTHASKAKYLSRARWIERVEVSNFRPIERVDVAFTENEITGGAGGGEIGAPRVGWLMLLGENASGKSSLLQAVALTLIGRKWREELIERNQLNPERFLRSGATDGFVRVHLSGSLEPVEMRFTRGSRTLEGGPEHAIVAVMAYGSTRLLPRAGMVPRAPFDYARVDNLFNPFEPLNDASEWLANLPDEQFNHLARTLKKPLQLGEDCQLFRQDRQVMVRLYDRDTALEELSDGFQSVLALVADIMRVMVNNGWTTMEQAEGIVLLDEIGSHLHPRWRMRVVNSLRETFPRIQFLASTHDPLCLRGLGDGEVVVMRRDQKRRVHAITELPSVRGLRADQLLTSEFFGMSSTIDPELEDLFTEYYMLLANPKRNATHDRRVETLKARLEPFKVLGGNRRERLMLETIDEFLAAERNLEGGRKTALKSATKRRLQQIWHNTPPTP